MAMATRDKRLDIGQQKFEKKKFDCIGQTNERNEQWNETVDDGMEKNKKIKIVWFTAVVGRAYHHQPPLTVP